MIRFKDGAPYAMHLSSHSDGEAYEWSALEKNGIRPLIYPAEGSRKAPIFPMHVRLI